MVLRLTSRRPETPISGDVAADDSEALHQRMAPSYSSPCDATAADGASPGRRGASSQGSRAQNRTRPG